MLVHSEHIPDAIEVTPEMIAAGMGPLARSPMIDIDPFTAELLVEAILEDALRVRSRNSVGASKAGLPPCGVVEHR